MSQAGVREAKDGERPGGSAATRLPPLGFWSYARIDEELSAGKRLNKLRMLLMAELQQRYGREPIRLFQDITTIPHGATWEHEIKKALSRTTFFIPIITPNFIQSDWCCREVLVFLERQSELLRAHPGMPDHSRIFPIHYIDIEDVEPADPDSLSALRALQWFDFRPFRHRHYEEEAVQRALSAFAGSICNVLKIKVGGDADGGKPDRVAGPPDLRDTEPHPAARHRERSRRTADEAAAAQPSRPRRERRVTESRQRAAPKPSMHETRPGPPRQSTEGDRGLWKKWSAVPGRAVAWALLAAALLLIAYFVFGAASSPERRTESVSPSREASPPPAQPGLAQEAAWLFGAWREKDGDCADATRISGDGDDLIIAYGSNTHRDLILTATPDRVSTASRVYEREGNAIRYVLDQHPFTLVRCL